MSKKFKSQASSGRASGGLGGFGNAGFGTNQSSILSYVQEPPDYSTISDPNIVVAFKNLSKKDSTTKTKALEDLQTYVTVPGVQIEEGFLEAWVKLFPRLSIDSFRRVRQLSHTVNGQVCSKCGKRTVRHMPRIVGPWLAGTFDNDRLAARAASDALNLVFPTVEKIQGLRRAFQHSLLAYSRDAALHETVQTLSDERVVTAEDAEATFARVVATSLAVIDSLISELPLEDQAKEQFLYDEIFAESKLWELVNLGDVAIRRAIHRLISTAVRKQTELVKNNGKAVSSAYVYKGLHSDQTGSAIEFLRVLQSLTETFPSIWTHDYSGKRSAASRLQHFINKGSQSSSSSYWEWLGKLFRTLPAEVLPTGHNDVSDILSAARSGVSKKDERFNASSAWPAYFTLADVVTSPMSDAEVESILDEQILPVIREYLNPAPETIDWKISGAKAAWVVSRVKFVRKFIPALKRRWPEFVNNLIDAARSSQPEQSKDFEKSQLHVASAGERLLDLQRELWSNENGCSDQLEATFIITSSRLLQECSALLKSRNGEPYGAAAIIELVLRTCGDKLLVDEDFRAAYLNFAQTDLPGMLFTPSQRQLIHSLYAIGTRSEFPAIFMAVLREAVEASESAEIQVDTLRNIFARNMPAEAAKIARETSEFQAFLVNSVKDSGNELYMDLFSDLIRLRATTPEAVDEVLSDLTSTLSLSDQAEESLSAMGYLSKVDDTTLKGFTAKKSGTGEQLLPSLLRLEQSSDDKVADRAASLSSKLSSTILENGLDAKYSVALQNLENVSRRSLPMEAMYDLTARVVGPEGKVQNASDMLPSIELWLSALRAALQPPPQSLALLSSLGGAINLVHKNEHQESQPAQYDSDGLSQAVRIAMYVGRLLKETDLLAQLDDKKETWLALLHVSVLIVEDNISITGANGLLKFESVADNEMTMLEFVSESNIVLSRYWRFTKSELDDLSSGIERLVTALETLQAAAGESSPLLYYVLLSQVKQLTNLFEIHGFSSAEAQRCEAVLKQMRSSKKILPLAACIASYQQPLSGTATLARLCNELIADLTDIVIVEGVEDGLQKLILLNTILYTQEDAISAVAKQRVIFLVKKLLPWLGLELPIPVKAEICKALVKLLPGIRDMYGEHWDQALSFLVDYWGTRANIQDDAEGSEARILLDNYSFKLERALSGLTRPKDEANDDLVDAFKAKGNQMYDNLVRLLIAENGIDDSIHQPLRITHELLARATTGMSKGFADFEDLYPLLYTPSRSIEEAAFALLQREIQNPERQDKISFDAALENKTAQLPDELISLILEAPTLDSLIDASFDQNMPITLQGYLYSWRLIFDYVQGGSYRVKNDYVGQLKDGTYLGGLLRLTFDFLGHTRGKPVDVSKFEEDIRVYDRSNDRSPEKEVQVLLSHLYYLSLKHLPSLVKSYYLDIRSRQTSQAVESWTAKYISPMIIKESLQEVDGWSKVKNVDDDPEFDKMTIKVSMQSREVNVNYVVDEQTMAIKVVLPEAYPLASAQVIGVSRVAVKEEKWQSWLRNCQGVITFSNGSIQDGITAWRKNVTGALKGQTECAICYSIISADKQLPTKKCPTCKNLFHSSCLFKWFKTSNASTCPLCRNPFNFN